MLLCVRFSLGMKIFGIMGEEGEKREKGGERRGKGGQEEVERRERGGGREEGKGWRIRGQRREEGGEREEYDTSRVVCLQQSVTTRRSDSLDRVSFAHTKSRNGQMSDSYFKNVMFTNHISC